MSQYRDDRDAARQRIADLEAQLAEQEASLSEKHVSLAEKEAEVARLRHQLILAGILGARTRPVHSAMATRLVMLSGVIACAALGVGLLAMRAPRPVVIEVVQSPGTAKAEPILADPMPVANEEKPTVEETAGPPPLDEAAVRKQLEPKVWAGQASVDEIRMLKAICSHQGDRVCRDRAASFLKDRKPNVF